MGLFWSIHGCLTPIINKIKVFAGGDLLWFFGNKIYCIFFTYHADLHTSGLVLHEIAEYPATLTFCTTIKQGAVYKTSRYLRLGPSHYSQYMLFKGHGGHGLVPALFVAMAFVPIVAC